MDVLTLYNHRSCILSFINQGSLFYDCTVKDILKDLQTLQNKCLQLVKGKKHWDGTINTPEKLNLLTTVYIQKLNLLKYAHKLSFTPNNIKKRQTRSLRSNRKILLKEPRSNCRQFVKRFLSKSVKFWDSLPEDCEKIRSIHQFKIHQSQIRDVVQQN